MTPLNKITPTFQIPSSSLKFQHGIVADNFNQILAYQPLSTVFQCALVSKRWRDLTTNYCKEVIRRDWPAIYTRYATQNGWRALYEKMTRIENNQLQGLFNIIQANLSGSFDRENNPVNVQPIPGGYIAVPRRHSHFTQSPAIDLAPKQLDIIRLHDSIWTHSFIIPHKFLIHRDVLFMDCGDQIQGWNLITGEMLYTFPLPWPIYNILLDQTFKYLVVQDWKTLGRYCAFELDSGKSQQFQSAAKSIDRTSENKFVAPSRYICRTLQIKEEEISFIGATDFPNPSEPYRYPNCPRKVYNRSWKKEDVGEWSFQKDSFYGAAHDPLVGGDGWQGIVFIETFNPDKKIREYEIWKDGTPFLPLTNQRSQKIGMNKTGYFATLCEDEIATWDIDTHSRLGECKLPRGAAKQEDILYMYPISKNVVLLVAAFQEYKLKFIYADLSYNKIEIQEVAVNPVNRRIYKYKFECDQEKIILFSEQWDGNLEIFALDFNIKGTPENTSQTIKQDRSFTIYRPDAKTQRLIDSKPFSNPLSTLIHYINRWAEKVFLHTSTFITNTCTKIYRVAKELFDTIRSPRRASEQLANVFMPSV